jgi:hypothetical protein
LWLPRSPNVDGVFVSFGLRGLCRLRIGLWLWFSV